MAPKKSSLRVRVKAKGKEQHANPEEEPSPAPKCAPPALQVVTESPSIRGVTESPPSRMGLNGAHYESLLEAMAFLKSLPAFDLVEFMAPSVIDEFSDQSAHIAPFDAKQCAAALKSVGTYVAGGNLFWVDCIFNVTPGVPLGTASLRQLKERYFKEPTKVFPDKITIGVFAGEEPDQLFGRLVRISPEEVIHVFLLAAAEDLKAHPDDMDRALIWRSCALSVPMEFTVCASAEARHWQAINLRETIGMQYATLYRSTIQRIFELAAWKASVETTSGKKMSPASVATVWKEHVQVSSMGESINVAFIDAAMTVWDRMCQDDECRTMLLQAEDRWGKQTPWDSVYKLEAVIKKCGRPGPIATRNIRWTLAAIEDLILDHQCVPGQLSVRALSGKGHSGGKGYVDVLLFKQDLATHATGPLLHELPISPDIAKLIPPLVNSHAKYREAFGFQGVSHPRQWLGSFHPTVQELILFIGDC